MDIKYFERLLESEEGQRAASMAMTDHIRTAIREEGFRRKIMPPDVLGDIKIRITRWTRFKWWVKKLWRKLWGRQ